MARRWRPEQRSRCTPELRWRACSAGSDSMLRRSSLLASRSSLPESNARIGDGVENVCQKAGEQRDDRRGHGQAENGRVIARQNRSEVQPSDAVPFEDLLHDHASRDEEGNDQAEQCDERNQRVTECMAPQYRLRRCSFCAGCGDVVLSNDFGQRRFGESREDRQLRVGQGDYRKDQMTRVIEKLLRGAQLQVLVGSHPEKRQDTEFHRKEFHQQQSHPEAGSEYKRKNRTADARSTGRPERVALHSPIGTPITAASRKAMRLSSNVFGSFCRIRVVTRWWSTIDVPKSSFRAPRSQ